MLSLIISPKCIYCKEPADIRFGLCAACLDDLIRYCPPNRCRICGLTIKGEGTICQRCFGASDIFDNAFFLFPYASQGRSFIHQVKFHDRKEWLDILAAAKERWSSHLRQWQPDAVTWVPSSLHTWFRRGYNVSYEIARIVAAELDIPLIRLLKPAHLFKPSLSKVKAPARRRQIVHRFLEPVQPTGDHLNVLLVDDVFTTGTTANHAARLMKQTGHVDTVSVFTLARVID